MERSPPKRFTCYLCEKEYKGNKLGSTIGSGKFVEKICIKCTKENYVWDNNPVSNIRQVAKKLGLKV